MSACVIRVKLMKVMMKSGAAAAAVLTMAACFASPVAAGGLYDRGSVKDDYVPYMREVSTGAGPCYFRADVGYSISRDPDIKWSVTNNDQVNGDYSLVGDSVSGVNMENSWFGEAGFGCGSGSRGFRAEVMLGVRGDRNIDGEPLPYVVHEIGEPARNVDDDPLHTSLRSYTAMFNVYKDLGNYSGFTPYVGAGVGLAYNKLSEVYFTDNPYLTNRIEGNSDLSFAWSLMAGVGYQVSERAILDFGYRFMDMGSIESGRVDSGGFANPPVRIDDLYAHEFKVGLRYHFGGSEPASYK